MPILNIDYKPRLLFRNGHVHTIYPALFAKPEIVAWQRQRLLLPDGDFLDLDWKKQGSKRLVVLGHGLEGSSNSSYILSATRLFALNGFDVLAWNHRSCSGELNRLPRFYHHGVSEDLHQVLAQTGEYNEVHCVGYSLGGNVLLKYLGEDWTKPQNLKSAIAVSSPIDLPSCVIEIHRRKNKLYHNVFLKTLKEKVTQKAAIMPDALSAKVLENVKTLTDFDTFFTAPLHGFLSADDYYHRASSKPLLDKISVPTLLLQAKDDPMLSEKCFPTEIAKNSNAVFLLVTEYGGHVAFMQPGSKWRLMEKLALDFALGDLHKDQILADF